MNGRRTLAVLIAWLLFEFASLAFSSPLAAAPPTEKKPPTRYDATDRYEVRKIEGWRVLVNKDFVQNENDLCRRTLRLVRVHLYQITRTAPSPALKKLRQVPIWVEENEPHHACMAYHPDAKWLMEHNMNPDKARCVELANARNFLKWTHQQPWMVLHELAHAYHHQFLEKGFDNPRVLSAFKQAKAAGKYDQVRHINGKMRNAYAMTNQMEHFAEASEAFFGVNDFYPFVRAELKQHDPDTHQALEELWGKENDETK